MGGSKDQNSKQGGAAAKKTAKSTSKPAKQNEREVAEHQRKAELESKIRERVAAEARAFDVINRLIEPNITAEFLLQACLHIDHNHYTDIVEERSIVQLCGYPLCSNALSQVAKKKYQISTRTNTVYDITERKKFCSSKCYQASEHLRKQIPETPVWTRRGADMEPFDLLHSDVSSRMEGEEVIGNSLFSLREEVSMLEKLDRMEEKAARSQKAATSQKAKPAKPDRVSFEESQRLSDQLLSLSREEDLERGMGELSLNAGSEQLSGENGPGVSGDTHRGIAKGVQSEGERQKKEGSEGKCDQQKDSGEEVEKKAMSVPNEDLALESSMKDLTLRDSGERNSVDSDDDDTQNGDGGDSKSQLCDQLSETQNSAVSKTQPERHGQEGVDSDDDVDEEVVAQDGNGSVSETAKSDSFSKSQGTDGSQKAGDECTHTADEKPKDNALKQQPGESKSAYLMRLLDQRRNLLSKVADIQSGVPDPSKPSESKSSSSTGSTGKSDNARSTEPDGKENTDEKKKFSTDGSEKVKQGKKQTLGVSGPSRKKKSAQTHEKPSASRSKVEVSPIGSICDVMSAWITAETLDYLGLNSDQGKNGKGDGSESTDTFHKDPEIQKKYQDLCQRLAAQEKDFDDIIGEEEMEGDKKRGGKKPLPSYADLKKETEQYQLRVQQFMAGSMTTKSKPTKPKADEDGGEKGESERPITLPDLDAHDQMLIRKRLVLERLDHTMPGLATALGLSVRDISAALRELVFTFSLSSHNIVLKPVEWTLAGIILLKLLERKSVEVRAALQSQEKSGAFSLVLSRMGHSLSSLDHLVHDMLARRAHALGGQGSQADAL